MTSIVSLSDTHGFHRQMIGIGNGVPKGDILLHAGDFTAYGTSKEIVDFDKWLGLLPHEHKIVIAGNHDRAAFDRPKEEVQKLFKNAIYLQEDLVEIDGIRIYGSPWTPTFGNWYFMADRGERIREKWDKIPPCDILLTHGPPHGILDTSVYSKTHVGCEELLKKIREVRPTFHVFGHIHAWRGMRAGNPTSFINASICNEGYKPIQKPYIFHF